MPVEKTKVAESRCRQGSTTSSSSNAASGKKRKKKKKVESASDTRGAKLASGAEKNEKERSSRLRSEAIVKALETRCIVTAKKATTGGASFILIGSAAAGPVGGAKCNDVSSSSSSIENSRPTTKIGRFDYSSSDAMSLGGQTTSASSSAAMEVSNGGDPLSSSTPTVTPQNPATTRSDSAPTVVKTAQDSCSVAGPRTAATAGVQGRESSSFKDFHRQSIDLALESLRWEHEYSDEEKEKERIEVYKENRRKRYENALAERKAQLQLQTSNRVKYIIS